MHTTFDYDIKFFQKKFLLHPKIGFWTKLWELLWNKVKTSSKANCKKNTDQWVFNEESMKCSQKAKCTGRELEFYLRYFKYWKNGKKRKFHSKANSTQKTFLIIWKLKEKLWVMCLELWVICCECSECCDIKIALRIWIFMQSKFHYHSDVIPTPKCDLDITQKKFHCTLWATTNLSWQKSGI